MASSRKIGPQKLKVGDQQAAALKAKKARIAKENRIARKEKEARIDAELSQTREAKRTQPKKSSIMSSTKGRPGLRGGGLNIGDVQK
jgi:hypothetical protein